MAACCASRAPAKTRRPAPSTTPAQPCPAPTSTSNPAPAPGPQKHRGKTVVFAALGTNSRSTAGGSLVARKEGHTSEIPADATAAACLNPNSLHKDIVALACNIPEHDRSPVVAAAKDIVRQARRQRGDNRTRDDWLVLLLYARLLIALGRKKEARLACVEGLRHGAGLDITPTEVLGTGGHFRVVGGGTLAHQDEIVLGLKFQLCQTRPVGGHHERLLGMLEEVAQACENKFGSESMQALEPRLYMAKLSSRPLKDARAEFEALLPRVEAALGAEHFLCLMAKNNFCSVLLKLEKHSAALHLQGAVVRGYIGTLGENHPLTLRARNNLGVGLSRAGNVLGALRELREVVDRNSAILGPTNAKVLNSKWNLALLLRDKLGGDEHHMAEKILRQCVNGARQNPTMGREHKDTRLYSKTLHRWKKAGAKQRA